MPVKNEAGRYLSSALENLTSIIESDKILVFDDCSDDDTVELALGADVDVCIRGENDASFLEHEGRFRGAMWACFEYEMSPSPGDWVLAIDADECLVTTSPGHDIHDALLSAVRRAADRGCTSVRLPVPEVFGYDHDGTPMVRTDGFWGKIAGTRLFAYQPGGVFRNKAMASGSEPAYVQAGRISEETFGLALMHFGYAQVADQIAKHARYTALLDHGHSDKHVQSIIATKTLERWRGPAPSMRLGVKEAA